jgi:hypothetical protein
VHLQIAAREISVYSKVVSDHEGRAPVPDTSFLRNLERVRGRPQPRWRGANGQRLYEWDARHGHVEVYNSRGHHLGVADATSGKLIGAPVAGRKIDV